MGISPLLASRIATAHQGSDGAALASGRIPMIGYIRVSTYYEDKISPEIQRAAIQAWADRSGAVIVQWIEDLDESGRSFSKRKIMMGIRAVETGEARGIAVWRYSRFGRSRHGNAMNLARLEHVGGRLESATEYADTSTAFGRLQQGLAFKFAEFESDRIGEQWGETREARRSRGLPSTGGERWGYIWHRRHLDDDKVLHPEWYEPDAKLGLLLADIYGRIVEEREPMNSVCLWLGRNGYTGRGGRPWSQTGLTRRLDSGWAAGWLRYHPIDCTCPIPEPDATTHRAALCPKREFVPGAHEPVVAEDLWERYKERRKIMSSVPPRSQTASYPLSGLVRCGRCGSSAAVTGGSTVGAGGVTIKKPGYMYRCSRRAGSGTCGGVYLLRTVAERTVLDRLAAWQREIEVEAQALPRRARVGTGGTRGTDALRHRLKARLQEIDQELDEQTRLLGRRIIPEASYIRERDRLAAEQISVTRELAALDEVPAETDRVALLPVVAGLLERWEITPVATRRETLRSLIRGVWAYPAADGASARAVAVAVWEEQPELVGQDV